MLSNYFLLPGTTVFLVGLIVAWVFKHKTAVKLNVLFWGALAWSASIIIKLVVSFLFNSLIYQALTYSAYGIYLFYVYIGLLTGIFEVFIPLYVIRRKLNLFTQTKDQLGFGIGFGCFEAVVLGLASIAIFFIVSYTNVPNLIGAYEINQKTMMEAAFYGGVERLSAVAIHVLSSMLIFFYVFKKRMVYLGAAIVYKTFVDAMAAYFSLSPIVFSMLQVEAFFGAIALISLIVLREMLGGKPVLFAKVVKKKRLVATRTRKMRR